MALPLEKSLQTKVLAFLKTLPFTFAYKAQAVSIGGIPDVIACCRGLFISAEIKRTAKLKPTPLQDYTLKQIRNSGGIALVVSPENWGHCREAIKLFANGEINVQTFIQRLESGIAA